MRQQARRTDVAIVIVILIMVIIVLFNALKTENASDQDENSVTIESYNGKTLGTMPGSQYEADTNKYFPDSTIVYYTGIPELYTALVTGKIDGFVMSEVTLRQMKRESLNMAWFPDALDTRYRYYGFAKTGKGEKLRIQMNEMLAEFKSDGTMARLEEIWYGDDETLKTVDASGLTGENGTLRIGVSSMDESYNYIRDNQMTGFNIDIVTRFARRYGYALEYTDTEPPSLLIGLTTGKFDMLATAISYTEERAQSIFFSDPALQFNSVLTVRKDDLSALPAAEKKPALSERIADSFEKNFIREARWKLILKGVGVTCLITFSAAVFGTIIAFALCMFRRTGSTLANIITSLYVKILQGTPTVVLLLILYYVVFGKSNLAAVWVAVVGFSLHFGAYISEVLRSGIHSVDAGQREAALAMGYTENQAFFNFILPQAVKHIMPVYRGEIISLLKSTAVAGYISVQELTKMSDIIRSRTYEAFFPLITTAMLYFLLAWIIGLLLKIGMDLTDPRRKGGKKK